MAVLGLGLLVLAIVVPKDQQRGVGYLTAVTLAVILVLSLGYRGGPGELTGGLYLLDSYAVFFKVLFLLAAILATVASYDFVQKTGKNQAEFYSVMVFATLGMMILASAGDLITMYMGLELMSISFCILVAFNRKDAKSQEAGVKYILLAAMSSGVLLYGLSLIYGLTQTTMLGEIVAALSGQGMTPLLTVAVIFVVAGFAFKISAVPFHMWAPDIYEGAPTAVTAFLAVGSKAAGFAAMIRLFMMALPTGQMVWGILLTVLCLLTVVVGNLIAIPQTNIKRLLAYSSIAQAGYILLGVISYSRMGLMAVMLHSLLYVFANMAAFMVANTFHNATGSDEIKDYSGLAQRAPVLASVMLFAMLSLAGIPPLAGFVTKFYLFTSAIDRGFVWLALISIVMSMVSVYYYLQVAKAMFINDPPEDAQPLNVSPGTQVALIACFLIILAVGIYPGPITTIATNVALSFLR